MSMKNCQEIYESELVFDPPKPPWIMFPDIHPYDMFWRMRRGEEHIEKLAIYFQFCGEERLNQYKKLYPEPEDWKGWFEDEN